MTFSKGNTNKILKNFSQGKQFLMHSPDDFQNVVMVTTKVCFHCVYRFWFETSVRYDSVCDVTN